MEIALKKRIHFFKKITLSFKPTTKPSLCLNSITSEPRRSLLHKVLADQNSQVIFRASHSSSKFLVLANTKFFSRSLKIITRRILHSLTQTTPPYQIKTTKSRISEGTQSTQCSSSQMTTTGNLRTKAKDSLFHRKVDNFRRLTTKTTTCLNKRDNSNSSCNQLEWHMSGLR